MILWECVISFLLLLLLLLSIIVIVRFFICIIWVVGVDYVPLLLSVIGMVPVPMRGQDFRIRPKSNVTSSSPLSVAVTARRTSLLIQVHSK